MSVNALLFAISCCTAALPPSLDADLEQTLETAGLSTRTARFDPTILAFFRAQEYATPVFESAWSDPWKLPWLAETLKKPMAGATGKPQEVLGAGGRMLGVGTRRTLLGDPVQPSQEAALKANSFEASLAKMREAGLIKGNWPDTKVVPEPVRQAASLVIEQALKSVQFRRTAFRQYGDLAKVFDEWKTGQPATETPERTQEVRELMGSVDRQALLAGAYDVTAASVLASEWAAKTPADASYEWRVDTSWGAIVLSGAGKTSGDLGPIAIRIDTGGDDDHVAVACNRSPGNWISVCIDTHGNDFYGSQGANRQSQIGDRFPDDAAFGPGRALFGVSILVDRSGNDHYLTHRPGLGSASFGASVLYDHEGNDLYQALADAQGYATFGVGILDDAAGNDVYQGYTQVQAFGGVGGFGGLVDRAGNDRYGANDTDIRYPSPQSKEHNVSMSQGAACGRRADYSDGHSQSGGVGWLLDLRGDDEYRCGVFGQGVGYWEGVGLLTDDQGDDRYNGVWYVQGAAAHFAIGGLFDSSGADQYTATMNMAQGAGHDFSIGWLMDGSGDDQYRAPNLSLGAGNANGIGAFVDLLGSDRYQSAGITLGMAAEAQADSIRERGLCLGLFFDGAGVDQYAGPGHAVSGKRSAQWTGRRVPAESQVGVFFDK